MTKKTILFATIFIVGLQCFSFAQKTGTIEITADKRIADLVDTHILFNEKLRTTTGYRIMIASLSGNNSKSAAFGIKSSFLKENPDVSAYLVFDEPNFKVKIGDFKSQLEAYAFLQKVKLSYPNAYIIKDNVYTYKLDSKDEYIDDEFNN